MSFASLLFEFLHYLFFFSHTLFLRLFLGSLGVDLDLKDDLQSVLRSLRTSMFVSLTRWKVNRCYSLRTTYLIYEAFFQQLHWFLQLRSCVIKWYEKERSIKLRPLRIRHNGDCFQTLNLLHVRSCEMFTFCDVFHETKQKTQTNSRPCAERNGNHL